jgi:hypothetical protein
MIDEIFEMGSGYVLNFSDRTMAEYFEDELGIEIYDEKYAINGTSKAKHIRAFIEVEDGYIVGQLLRKLWDHRNSYSERSENGVWSKYSCGFPMIIFQQPTQAFFTAN